MTTSFSPKLILIDVDGTLVDSVPDLAYCIDEMMKAIGQAPHGDSVVRNWVGNGVERLVKRALVGKLEGEPDTNIFNKAYPIFLDLYKENTSKRSLLYPGVEKALQHFSSKKYHLGCVTNKAEAFTIPLLKDLKLYDYFSIVICGDTLAKKKPDPLPLLHAAKHFNVEPTDSLMLGDSVSDVKAARAANFSIACMSYGYNHGDNIEDANPDLVVDSMDEVIGHLN
ncbi:MAG: phosphoglycolate phosphatase [Methylococcales bacterium]|jgi:phosphoglycolate phosphatase|nr:phosphoglycolate phosphatase [Methylococcales bacterium]MBT7409754.1 phosphoglycolate phosphatase [Methylococcales bacterium]